MPAFYDKLERTWRAEQNDGTIAGYFTTEAAALAALGPADDAEAEPLPFEPSRAAERELARLVDAVDLSKAALAVVTTYEEVDDFGGVETFTCGDTTLILGDDGTATLNTHKTLLSFNDNALCQLREFGAIFHHPDVTRYLDMSWSTVESEAAPLTLGDGSNGALKDYEAQLYRALVRCGLTAGQVRDVFGHVKDVAEMFEIRGHMKGYSSALDAIEERLRQRKAAA